MQTRAGKQEGEITDCVNKTVFGRTQKEYWDEQRERFLETKRK